MKLEPVIGLETHVQLKTKTKLFCGCNNDAELAAANAYICPVCLGHPGVLPVPNKQAIDWAILIGLALNGSIAGQSKFDRKHYFYPDLPKAYQISQYDLPIMSEGFLDLDVPGVDENVRIGIERLHLEEDAAKNIHGEDGKTYIDFNRGGTPLCEIVTKPHFKSAGEAKTYLQELRTLVRSLGVSDGDMEKGQLRCDVNISLRPVGDAELYPKTEIKNVNSFKAVERSIEYEIKRQTKLWEMNTPPTMTTTRGWNDPKQMTVDQRTKEGEADYRYFPEPDIPPLDLRDKATQALKTMPELPQAKRQRLIEEYGFKKSDAYQIVEDVNLADFAEQSLSELGAWLNAHPDIESAVMEVERKKLMKLFTSWVLNKLPGLLSEKKLQVKTMDITPENFAEFIILIASGQLTNTNGLLVLGKMLDTGGDPSHIMEDMGAKRVDNDDELAISLDAVIERYPDEFERYKTGETKLMQFLIGQMMKETKGNADPAIVTKLINQKIK